MTRVLGTCLAAATLALTAAGPAFAARGFLYIDGMAIREPSGCYQLGDFVPSYVVNDTDQVVVVWSGSNCTGTVDYVINPGGSHHGGRSVFI
jgi:hypothetical protein